MFEVAFAWVCALSCETNVPWSGPIYLALVPAGVDVLYFSLPLKTSVRLVFYLEASLFLWLKKLRWPSKLRV